MAYAARMAVGGRGGPLCRRAFPPSGAVRLAAPSHTLAPPTLSAGDATGRAHAARLWAPWAQTLLAKDEGMALCGGSVGIMNTHSCRLPSPHT